MCPVKGTSTLSQVISYQSINSLNAWLPDMPNRGIIGPEVVLKTSESPPTVRALKTVILYSRNPCSWNLRSGIGCSSESITPLKSAASSPLVPPELNFGLMEREPNN